MFNNQENIPPDRRGESSVEVHNFLEALSKNLSGKSKTKLLVPAAEFLNTPVVSDSNPSLKSYVRNVKPSYLSEGLQNKPIGTNKFYTCLVTGSGKDSCFLEPYEVFFNDKSLAINYRHRRSTTLGPIENGAAKYAYMPPKVNAIGVSSHSIFAAGAKHEICSMEHNSCLLRIYNQKISNDKIEFPLLQGLAYITAKYFGSVPLFESQLGFRSWKLVENDGINRTWRITLGNNSTWFIFMFPYQQCTADLKSYDRNIGLNCSQFYGCIQIAGVPSVNGSVDECFQMYRRHSGTFVYRNVLDASVNGQSGMYSFRFITESSPNTVKKPALMLALPHHVIHIVNCYRYDNIRFHNMPSGFAVPVSGDVWYMIHQDLPCFLEFMPLSLKGAGPCYSHEILQKIVKASSHEVKCFLKNFRLPDSVYFAGKELSKYAQLCLTIKMITRDMRLYNTAIEKLESVLQLYIDNRAPSKLIYDNDWKGIIVEKGLNDAGVEFGNGYYNDHNFHWGYFVYTAAVIGFLDPSWLTQRNREWVNMLVRDFANPNEQCDRYFPEFRSFDWYRGHSWAHGVGPQADGKDEESSSEDYHSLYALKLWGKVIGDTFLETRSNLMLSIARASFNYYYMMRPDNSVQIPELAKNFVPGILFQNKIDYTTWFGTNTEYIHGIQMLPFTPISPYMRLRDFVEREWQAKLSSICSTVNSGWRSLLEMNRGLFDPQTALRFFTNDSFKREHLDPGASHAWYIALVAAWAS